MRILIAEDDEVSLLLLEATLKKLGHSVVATTNGRDAWEAFQKEYFPVLISDWMMPELDGLAVCRAVRSTHRDHYTIIILLTALGGKAHYLEAMKAGADDFITKPLDGEQLAARLAVAERILGLREHVKHLEGILPICSHCKRIRDEKNEWKQLETYIAQRSEARFSHGICPECRTEHFHMG
jgi:sigma-B regulation protein RsbU (phosphoserine phosphatase)